MMWGDLSALTNLHFISTFMPFLNCLEFFCGNICFVDQNFNDCENVLLILILHKPFGNPAVLIKQ